MTTMEFPPAEFATSDRVQVNWGGKWQFGIVHVVTDARQQTKNGLDLCYTVRVVLGLAYVGPENIKAETTPPIEVGQWWITPDRQHRAKVEEVLSGGLMAYCGPRYGKLVLASPHWMLDTDQTDPTPAAELSEVQA